MNEELHEWLETRREEHRRSEQRREARRREAVIEHENAEAQKKAELERIDSERDEREQRAFLVGTFLQLAERSITPITFVAHDKLLGKKRFPGYVVAGRFNHPIAKDYFTARVTSCHSDNLIVYRTDRNYFTEVNSEPYGPVLESDDEVHNAFLRADLDEVAVYTKPKNMQKNGVDPRDVGRHSRLVEAGFPALSFYDLGHTATNHHYYVESIIYSQLGDRDTDLMDVLLQSVTEIEEVDATSRNANTL